MSVIYLTDLAGVLFGPVTLPVVPGIGVQLPNNAVCLVDELPAPADGFVWVLAGGEPVQCEDQRGTVYSTATGDPQEHNELGALPEGLTAYPRPSLAYAWIDGQWQVCDTLLAALRAQAESDAWTLIKAERDSRSLAGIKVGSLWVHSDLFSRSQWLGHKDSARDVLAAGGDMTASLPDGAGKAITWKMLDGITVPVTVQLAFDAVAAVGASDRAIFAAADMHKSAMQASIDPATYDFSAGWPASYSA